MTGRGDGVGAGDGVVESSSGGGGVLDGVAGLQHTNTTHMQCSGGISMQYSFCGVLINNLD